MAPTLVQYRTVSNCQGNLTTLTKVKLPNVVLSGNIVIVCIQIGSGKTISTLTDDKSNTYTQAVSRDDGSQIVRIYYAKNVTNGPQEIQITYGGSGANFVGFHVSEWYNVDTSAPADGSGTGNGSGTALSLNVASMTTASAGDLIMSIGVQDSTSAKITSWTKASGYTLIASDLEDSLAVEYQIQVSAGSTTPTFTQSPSNSWCMVAAGFKAASAGTAPQTSTVRVIGIAGPAVNRNGSGASDTVPLPYQGTALVSSFIGVASDLLTSITDTAGNTWTAAGANNVNGGSGNVRVFHCLSPAAPSDTNVATLNFGGPGAVPGSSVFMFDLFIPSGYTISQDGTIQTASGTATGSGAFNGASITPSTANGLLIFTLGVTSNTVIAGAVSHGTGTFDSGIDPNEEVSPWARDENNGWMHCYNGDTTAVQSSWTPNTDLDEWADTAVAYKLVASGPIDFPEGDVGISDYDTIYEAIAY